MVIGYYGESGDRPRIVTNQSVFDLNGSYMANVAIVGLDLYAVTRDPSSDRFPSGDLPGAFAGIRLVGTGENILLEDLRMRYFTEGITVDACCPQAGGPDRFSNIAVRRVIVQFSWIPGSYSNKNICNGMYAADVDGLLIEECLFDQNGYNDDVPDAGPNQYNHNIYLQYTSSGTITRGNLITRAAAHGIQQRSFGLAEDNFFAQNSISINFGGVSAPTHETEPGLGRYMVITEGTLMDPQNSSPPRTSAVWALPVSFRHADLEHIIVANRIDSGNNNSIFAMEGGSKTETDNIVYQWHPSRDQTNSAWLDPERSIGSYHGSLGETATLDAFIAIAAERPLRTWSEAYTAYAVNAYIREGFRSASQDYIDAAWTSRSVHEQGGAIPFEILSNMDWTVEESANWIEADAASGSGDAVLTLTVAPNSGEERRASVFLVNGAVRRELEIIQQGLNTDPFLSLSPTVLSFDGVLERDFEVITNTDWTLEISTDWLEASVTSGSGDTVVTLTAEAPTGRRRGATVTVTTGGGLEESLSIIQTGKAVETTWAGFPIINEAGDVNTTLDFIGWVNVAKSPWIYSYDLRTYLYLPESWVSENGAWVLVSGVVTGQSPAVDNGFGSWNGLPKANTKGDVLLGQRFGWIYVERDPYLFSYDVQKWFYFSQLNPDTHFWMYLYR
jgi:hypothetical protein